MKLIFWLLPLISWEGFHWSTKFITFNENYTFFPLPRISVFSYILISVFNLMWAIAIRPYFTLSGYSNDADGSSAVECHASCPALKTFPKFPMHHQPPVVNVALTHRIFWQRSLNRWSDPGKYAVPDSCCSIVRLIAQFVFQSPRKRDHNFGS